MAKDEVLVTRRESAYGWIDVTRDHDSENAEYIRLNLHYRLGGAEAMRERRQAHLPLLLHPDPKQVLFLGMGTGVTAAGAIEHSEVETVEIVELIPDVSLAARELGHRNSHVLDDVRVHVRTDDARHFLLGTENRYDVIVSDLFVPWENETGYLYTREHYEVAAERLSDGGLFCQWLPLYQLGKREFTIIADTFATVFPKTTLWWCRLDTNKPIVGLVGSVNSFDVHEDRLRDRIDRLQRSRNTRDPQLASSADLRMALIGSWELKAPIRLNTDEIPSVEFLTPQSLMEGKLIRGARLAQLWDDVLVKLPTTSSDHGAGFLGDAEAQWKMRQAQEFILFAK